MAPPASNAYAPLPTETRPVPEGNVATARSVMLLAGTLYVCWLMGVIELSKHLPTGADTNQGRMVAKQLWQTGGALLGDAMLGPWELAGAIGVSAFLARAPVKSVGAVGLRLWGAYAAFKFLFNLGLMFVCPGMILGFGLLVFADPIGRGEGSGPGFRVPPGRTAGAIMALGTIWGALQTPMQLGGAMWLEEAAWPIRLGTYALLEAINIAAILLWCVLARRAGGKGG